MFELSSSTSDTLPAWYLPLRRAGAAITILGAVALWLWALPALVRHQGFSLRGRDVCAPASYRDPITGGSRPAPSLHLVVPKPCAAPSGSRP